MKYFKHYPEMRAKGNHPIMAIFKIIRYRMFGGSLLLNKGWDFNQKLRMQQSRDAREFNRVSSAIARHWRRNGYDKPNLFGNLEVKNGRWVHKK